jgi:hypothetical protein
MMSEKSAQKNIDHMQEQPFAIILHTGAGVQELPFVH